MTRQNLFLKCCQTLEQKQPVQDLSKEELWVSVCQRAPKLSAVKVGCLTKHSAARTELNKMSVAWIQVLDDFDHPQCLRNCDFATFWPTETRSKNLERSWSVCRHIFWSRDWHYFKNRVCSVKVIYYSLNQMKPYSY